jgi:RNase P protein component
VRQRRIAHYVRNWIGESKRRLLHRTHAIVIVLLDIFSVEFSDFCKGCFQMLAQKYLKAPPEKCVMHTTF